MRILKNRKLIITSILAVMMILAAGIFAFSGEKTAFAQEDESIRDGYTMEDVQELLNSNNRLGPTEFIRTWVRRATRHEVNRSVFR